MMIRLISDHQSVTRISPKIIKLMEGEGYTLIASTEKQSRQNQRDRLCYLNFIDTKTNQSINDEL